MGTVLRLEATGETVEPPSALDLTQLYRQRFSPQELEVKRALWQVLCRQVFQKWVPVDGTVLDLAAGSCEFVNHIRAERRIAVDLNPDVLVCAAPGVEAMISRADQISQLTDGEVDTVFSSNFFEHLPSKDALLHTLRECHRVTRSGGHLVVMMPNIRYLGGRYWDYLDHHLPLTHVSLAEALDLSGFDVHVVVPRFLPYTVKDARLPIRAWMVSAYLRARPVWPLLGRQMLVVATRRAG